MRSSGKEKIDNKPPLFSSPEMPLLGSIFGLLSAL